MANLLKDLYKSLKAKEPIQGKVLSIGQGTVKVTTSTGIKDVINNTATMLREGDTVKLNGTAIIGILTDESRLPVYRL